MTSERRPLIELLSSQEIDELLEPENLHRKRQIIQSDNKEAQMEIVEVAFARIATAVKRHWGTQGFYPYMDSLLFTDRPDRLGFPPTVLAALGNLVRIHSRECPRIDTAAPPGKN